MEKLSSLIFCRSKKSKLDRKNSLRAVSLNPLFSWHSCIIMRFAKNCFPRSNYEPGGMHQIYTLREQFLDIEKLSLADALHLYTGASVKRDSNCWKSNTWICLQAKRRTKEGTYISQRIPQFQELILQDY